MPENEWSPATGCSRSYQILGQFHRLGSARRRRRKPFGLKELSSRNVAAAPAPRNRGVANISIPEVQHRQSLEKACVVGDSSSSAHVCSPTSLSAPRSGTGHAAFLMV